MLVKLQKRTVSITQLVLYAITLFFGVSICVFLSQLYFDVKPILTQQTEVFSKDAAVINKKIALSTSFRKHKIYFTPTEIKQLKSQSFIREVAPFIHANFKISAYMNQTASTPYLMTDLFFESIPNRYLDHLPPEWQWQEGDTNIPIIIPEDYVNLYNFGFAESQGLPVISKNTITQIPFKIVLSNTYSKDHFSGKIVGFTSKINSILVPESFMNWANNKYASSPKNTESQYNRLLIEFTDPSDEAILPFFKKHHYNINESQLEISKISYFIKTGFAFFMGVALLLLIISLAFIIVSVHLLFQKNKQVYLNLHYIGYTHQQMARFYQILISSITFIIISLSLIICQQLRILYISRFEQLFQNPEAYNYSYTITALLLILILMIYNSSIYLHIRKSFNQ